MSDDQITRRKKSPIVRDRVSTTMRLRPALLNALQRRAKERGMSRARVAEEILCKACGVTFEYAKPVKPRRKKRTKSAARKVDVFA